MGLTVEERFWKRVNKTDSCWLWTGRTPKKGGWGGYGRFDVGLTSVGAHRFSWELHFGKIPDDKQVLHECDVRNCVRPDHLFLGDHDDNMKDMLKKGRGKGPEKITAEQVLEIRKLAGTATLHTIGSSFGVSGSYVAALINRKRRKNAYPCGQNDQSENPLTDGKSLVRITGDAPEDDPQGNTADNGDGRLESLV